MKSCTLEQAITALKSAFINFDIKLIGHSEKVAHLFWSVVKESNLYEEKDTKRLIILSFFHDIGIYKTDIYYKKNDIDILNAEKHSIYGYLFLKYLTPLADIAEIVLHHHMDILYFRPYDNKYIEEIEILRFADKMERYIRYNKNIYIENNIFSDENFENEHIRRFLQSEQRNNILGGLLDNTYKKEFYKYLSSIELTRNEAIELAKMLVFIIDFRSPQTVSHSVLIAVTADIICQNFNIKKELKDKVVLAAFVHDIGKITTPLNILEKKGKLTDDEMKIMKNHVVESKNILEGMGLKEISDIGSLHHEKLDGSGYPSGIRGSEISFEARIIMVVDIFVALIGKRSYKEEYEKGVTISILKNLVANNKIDSDITNFVINNYDKIIGNTRVIKNKFEQLNDKISLEFEEILNGCI